MVSDFETFRFKIMTDLNDKLGELHEKTNAVHNDLQEERKDRELLEQAFSNFVKRMDSKIENNQTVSGTMLELGKRNKERIDSMATSIGGISGHAAQALNQSKKTDDKFNRLWMRIFFAIVGSTLLSQTILFVAFSIFGKG